IKALCPGQATISALTTDGSNLTASSEVTAFYWGDVNLDGFVDVVDISCIINLILNSPEIDIYDGRADANEDGFINVSDSNIIINLLLQQNLGKNKE
ncbi:MAG: dockerin type I domain-containing protein, partial [Sodaliphilus sp.]|nr:dockerin type I domain-containing protein [Sodaliphilus sp.]